MRRAAAALLGIALVAVACAGNSIPTGPVASSASPIPAVLATPRPSSTPQPRSPSPSSAVASPSATYSARPSLQSTGPGTPRPTPPGATPSADCVNGWAYPFADSDEFAHGEDLLKSQMRATGPWYLEEMRYFTGPDVPWIIEPHFDVVDYWYIRASLNQDPSLKGRWLLEYRSDDRQGIAAVAPYDTRGYASPDWTGFTGDGKPKSYPGLPGKWGGLPYDFVTGEGDSGQPGLPDEVVGCLSGT